MVNYTTSTQVKGEIYIEKNEQAVAAKLPAGIHLAQSQEEIDKVVSFRKSYYQDERQEVSDFHDDGLDQFGYVLYGEALDNITNIGRLLLDSEAGFPEEGLLPQAVIDMRNAGKKTC
jgi:hypothetical protein